MQFDIELNRRLPFWFLPAFNESGVQRCCEELLEKYPDLADRMKSRVLLIRSLNYIQAWNRLVEDASSDSVVDFQVLIAGFPDNTLEISMMVNRITLAALADKDILREANDQLVDQNDQLKASVQSQATELEKLTHKIDMLKSHEELVLLPQLRAENQELKVQQGILQTKLESSECRATGLLRVNSHLQSQIAIITPKHKTRKTKNTSTDGKVRTECEVPVLHRRLLFLEQEKELDAHQISRLKKLVAVLEEEMDSAQVEASKPKDCITALEAEAELRKGQIRELEERSALLANEKETADAKILDLNKHVSALWLEIGRLRKDNDDHIAAIASLDKLTERNRDLDATVKTFNRWLDQVIAERDAWRERAEDQDSLQAGLHARVAEVESDNRILDTNNEALYQCNAGLKNCNEALGRELDVLAGGIVGRKGSD